MSAEQVLGMIKGVFVVTTLVALYWFAVRPLLDMLRKKPDMDLLSPDFSQVLEEEELEIPRGGDPQKLGRSQMLEQAREDPRRTAMLVSQWLKDRR
ncbi:MAG: hypothetical protein OEZ59_11365 [Deltaproteobacteria bacterium]|nr:hypothetical protein [Deltaproteobacteria bacterium]